MREFLVETTATIPEGTDLAQVDRRRAAEAVRAKEVATTGNLVRLWRPVGELRSIGLWRAADEAEPHEKVLGTPPLRPWMTPVIIAVESHRATGAGPTPRADRRTCSRARPDMRATRQGHPSPNPQMKPAGACPAAWTPAMPLYRKEASCPMSPPATKATRAARLRCPGPRGQSIQLDGLLER
jgi:muconolactone D-isomerase